jgi:PAS domain S-box-containing protein
MWRKIKNLIGPFAVLIVGITVSYYFWSYFKETSENQINTNFEIETERAVGLIKEGIKEYTSLLYGIQGFWGASQPVERNEFRQYLETLDINVNYPGLYLVGFTERVIDKDKIAFVKNIQKEGYADFTIYPESDKDEYMVVKYLYPEKKEVLGFDVTSDLTRWEAQKKAIENGKEQLTERISLLNENKDPGFGMVLPIYRKGTEIHNIEERKISYEGTVSASFNASAFFDSVFSGEGGQFKNIRFEIYDSLREGEFSSATLVYKSKLGNENDPGYILYQEQQIDIAGRVWTILFWGKPKTALNGLGVNLPSIMFAIGIIMSILAFALYHLLSITKSRAEKRAEEITKELRTSEENYQRLLAEAPDAIVLLDNTGKITFVNKSAENLFNLKAKDKIGKNFISAGVIAASSLKRLTEEFRKHMAGGGDVRYEAEFIKKDKTTFIGEVNSKPVVRGGKVEGLQIIMRDISERKKSEGELRKRTAEAERLNRIMVGRELKMTELKKEVEKLRKKK